MYFTWADAGNPVGTPNRAAVTDWQVRVVGKSANPVTVWVNALAHYAKPTAQPIISFACDDGRRSQLTKMASALDKHGWSATAYLIVEYLGLANKITYDEAKLELEGKRRWEIAGHAYSIAAHDNGMTTLSPAALDQEMRNLRGWLQAGNHKGADLFAYPLGDETPAVVEVVSRYFRTARQITRVPYQNFDLDQPYRVRSVSLSSSDSLATAKLWVDKAVASDVWLIITVHDLVDGTPTAGSEWPMADFQALVDYIATKTVRVMPVGAALDTLSA